MTIKKGKNNNKNHYQKIIITICCILITISIVSRVKTIVDLSLKKAVLQKQELKLQEENKILAEEIKKLESPEAVERLAREKLGMVKKGERRVMELDESK